MQIELSRERVFGEWARRVVEDVTWGPAPCLFTRNWEEALQAVRNGQKVLFYGGNRENTVSLRAMFNRQIGAKNGAVFQYTQELTKSRLQGWLAEHSSEPDRVLELPGEPESLSAYTITICSTRQSGGSFIAWNLWDTLRRHGVDARLAVPDARNSIATWMGREDPFPTMPDSPADVWIIDASGGASELPKGDARIAVVDGDPAKGEVDGDFVLENRTPEGVPPFREAHEAMRTGVSVASQVPEFDRMLWELYHEIRGVPLSEEEAGAESGGADTERDGSEQPEQVFGFVDDVAEAKTEQVFGFVDDVAETKTEQVFGFVDDVAETKTEHMFGFVDDVPQAKTEQVFGFVDDVPKAKAEQVFVYKDDAQSTKPEHAFGFVDDIASRG